MDDLYITHCTYKKDDNYKITGQRTTPDQLYIGTIISRFINKCKKEKVSWAIFSDKYGVWFPEEKKTHYEKHPHEVTDEEFTNLVEESANCLKEYRTIYFYGNHKSPHFHPLYKKLIDSLEQKNINIKKITHLADIELLNIANEKNAHSVDDIKNSANEVAFDTAIDCEWLHNLLGKLPAVKYPYNPNMLPDSGIYFFYEMGEESGHGPFPRVVRIGTHKKNNFKSRIQSHYYPYEIRLKKDGEGPKDRSIFRKNIGRVLLNKEKPEYLPIWNHWEKYWQSRDLKLEKNIEEKISDIIQKEFYFKYIVIKNELARLGSKGLESRLIGTLSHCRKCIPSDSWLGNHSPEKIIKEKGLWLKHHLGSSGINEKDKNELIKICSHT